MSLDLSALKRELQENYLRTEQVLTGMDAYIAVLEKRISALEGQFAAVLASISDEGSTLNSQSPQLYRGRGG